MAPEPPAPAVPCELALSEQEVPPPHAARLARRIEGLREPLIQVWGWPGSGRAALLEELLTRWGERAVGLALGDLAGERDVREALESVRAGGARWLVAGACPEEVAAAAARWLRPGERLVFATDRRHHLPLPSAVVAPHELLLTGRELSVLWHLLAGTEPAAGAAAGLLRASDGWYVPLVLALEATGGAGLVKVVEEELLGLPEVRSFLRHQVLETLDAEERDFLLAWAESPDGEPPGHGASAAARRVIESRGLWVDRPDGPGPPRLLAALLARERRRRRTVEIAGEPAFQPVPVAPPAPVGSSGAAGAPGERGAAGAAGEPVAYVLGLLGEPIARRREGGGAERELDWRLRRSFQVLAYLASSPGLQAAREDLIEAVWPKEGERTIDRNFHPTLSHLRRALEGGERRGGGPPPLLFRSGIYRLNPEISWEIDVLELRRRIEEGKGLLDRADLAGASEVWQAGWRVYRGPFLQGVYEAWVGPRREAYQRMYLDLLRDLGDLYVKLGRLAEAMDAYRAVLVEDPLQERIHVAVMRLYAEQGRRDLVRRQYDKLCSMLLEELGVEPLPQTTREYHQLMG